MPQALSLLVAVSMFNVDIGGNILPGSTVASILDVHIVASSVPQFIFLTPTSNHVPVGILFRLCFHKAISFTLHDFFNNICSPNAPPP